MNQRRTVLVSLISALLCPAVFADDDALMEIPQPLNDFFQTESVFMQEAGEWQVSVGTDFTNDDAHKTTELSTGLEYGITNSVQIALEHMPYLHIKPKDDAEENISGQGNTSVGLKKGWMHIGDSLTSVALGYEHTFANDDAEVMADDDAEEFSDSDEMSVTVARELDKAGNTQASLQIGNERSAGQNEGFANLAVFHTIGNKVVTGEYNWSEEEQQLTQGIFWKPAKGLEVGTAIGFGMGNTDGQRLLTRVNYEF